MSKRTGWFLGIGIAVSLLLAGIVSFYASSSPDGLEKVAGDEGFLSSATAHSFESGPFAGYATQGIDNARLSGGLAGIVGVVIVLLIAGGLFTLLARHHKGTESSAA